MSLHLFRREEDGEVMVYPPFVAAWDGYGMIVWEDMTDAEAERLEHRARKVADGRWIERMGPTARSEKRREFTEWLPSKVRRMVRVTFLAHSSSVTPL